MEGEHEIVLVTNDWHVPFHDKKLLGLFKEFAADLKPDTLVINGDFLDCYEVSKFARVPGKNRTLSQELETGYSVLTELRELLPKARIIFIEGNHEFRLRSYMLRNAPELYGLQGLTIPTLLNLEKLHIEWVGTNPEASRFIDTFVKFGQLYVGHFDKVSKHSAYTAKSIIEERNVSILQGHVHRMGVHVKRGLDGRQLIGIENGCMCRIDPQYIATPNWHQGFSVVYVKKSSGRFHAYPIIVVNGGFIWGGKFYDTEHKTPNQD